jgi:hypothetical protein
MIRGDTVRRERGFIEINWILNYFADSLPFVSDNLFEVTQRFIRRRKILINKFAFLSVETFAEHFILGLIDSED